MNNSWQYSTVHNSACKVIEEISLWGQTVCLVWLPNQDAVVRLPLAALRPLDDELSPEIEAGRIAYVAAAAKVAEVLENASGGSDTHVLLAPMESNVIPLPHQLQVLSRAISGDRIRYLLADEVGLGKTIEAGLILRELKLRGLARRILIVAPVGLIHQWQLEMKTHFGETFTALYPGPFSPYHYCYPDRNVWTFGNQYICPLDAVKPLDSRKGWNQEQVDDHNRWRFLDLITSGWDLVIVDEAHRLAGGSADVARYKLGQGLAEASPYLLLLSATPHQGKSDAFHRLMKFLDDKAFPDPESISLERVAPYIIRTEKRRAIDVDSKPLFKPRQTKLVAINWADKHRLQKELYQAVTEYVQSGYNQALRDNQRHVAFLLILMQHLLFSSTRAIRATLEKRLAAIEIGQQETTQRLEALTKDPETPGTLFDLDGQELLDELLKMRLNSFQNEKMEVEVLLNLARRCEEAGPDAKAETLLEWLYTLQAEENSADLKVLIFTEFMATQNMLREFFEARGLAVAILNGSLSLDERQKAQSFFRDRARIMISTDAGGEGLNLQFCHVVINYDIPWNPMRLEQRIGRVDRIGQARTVRALNFIFEDSVEFRVREVLEQKLSVIFAEFGIDKTGDVLDTAQAGELFEEAFTSAILNPDELEASVEQTVDKIRHEVKNVRTSSTLYGLSEEPDAQLAEYLRSHPLPHWLEQMTVGYLKSHGGTAERLRSGWELGWPDGSKYQHSVFNPKEKERLPEATLLNLEDSRLRGLALGLPQVVAGQPWPRVTVDGLSDNLSGFWGLFEIRLQLSQLPKTKQSLRLPLIRRGYSCVFMNENGKLFLPTARHIWDALQTAEFRVCGTFQNTAYAFEQLHRAAEEAGQETFKALQQAHLASLAMEEERGQTSFASKHKAIARIGLPEVRRYRQTRCETEEAQWRDELRSVRQIVPEIRPLILMALDAGGAR